MHADSEWSRSGPYNVMATSNTASSAIVALLASTNHTMASLTTSSLLHTDGNSTSAPPTNSSDHDDPNAAICQNFVFIMYVVVFGVMALFGLIGNTISFLVLQWERHNYVATFLLQVMALIDNFFLLATGYSTMVSVTASPNTPIGAYNAVIAFPLVHITQLGTILITVLIAFNRYIAVCRPFQAHKLCTKKRVRIQVAAMCVFIVVYNIPRFLEYTVVVKNDTETQEPLLVEQRTTMANHPIYKIVYETVLYGLFVYLGPLVILIILNACLIQELMRARQRLRDRQLPGSTGDDQENNLTLVMIVIILIFLICQTPGCLNQILFFFLEDQYTCGKAYFFFYHCSNIIISANSSVNFIVYCIFRKQFRERLHAFCQRGRKHNLTISDVYDYNGRTTSVYSRNNSPAYL